MFPILSLKVAGVYVLGLPYVKRTWAFLGIPIYASVNRA